MITKEDLGNRIRLVRKQRTFTLKDLERVSGFSATHISEIERGKTSPTIGALVKIAKALGKETSYFLEEEQLSEIAVVRRNERQALPEEMVKVHGEYLTPEYRAGVSTRTSSISTPARSRRSPTPPTPAKRGSTWFPACSRSWWGSGSFDSRPATPSTIRPTTGMDSATRARTAPR